MEKKRILCFGDSLTWGYHPVTGERIGEDTRWTGVLQRLLGDEVRVIEEGQNGRTIARDDPAEGEKNGIKYVVPCMESQKPLDLMVIMLGSNNMKRRFCLNASDIAGEMEEFLKVVLSINRFKLNNKMKILLISPPAPGERGKGSRFEEAFDFESTVKVGAALAGKYKELAGRYGCSFLDAGGVVKVSEADGLHLDPEDQTRLGEAVYEAIVSRHLL